MSRDNSPRTELLLESESAKALCSSLICTAVKDKVCKTRERATEGVQDQRGKRKAFDKAQVTEERQYPSSESAINLSGIG